MKYRIFFAFAAALLLFSCQQPSPEPDFLNYPMKLEKKLVVADYNGGDYSIGYYLEKESEKIGIPDPENISIDIEADWIHNIHFSSNSMTFSVEANTSPSSRLANATVHYRNSALSLSISQSGVGENIDAISKMNFDISYEINGPHVQMTVVPEYDYVRYYIAYSKKSEVEQYKDRIHAVIKANVEKFLSSEINTLVTYGGYSFEAALDLYATAGTRTASMSLNGESDFVGWCCAISDEAKVISDVVMKEFRTGSIPPSDNRLEVSITDINCDRVSYSVNTSNQDQWASIVVPASEIEGLSDKEILDLFNSSEDVTMYLHFGPWDTTVKGLEADSDYVILNFGYSWGFNTTSYVKTAFHTLPYTQGGSRDFKLTLEKVTHYRAQCRIVPQEKTLLYYADLLYPGESVEEALKDINSQLDWMVSNNYGSRLEILRQMSYRGEQLISKTGLSGQSSYSFIVLPVDENSGDFTGDVICSESFTTPKAEQSSSYITLRKGEIYEQDSYAMLPLEVEMHGDVHEYWYCIYSGDLSNKEQYPDSLLLEAITTEDGIKNEPSQTIACEYNSTLTLVCVCYDTMDNWSTVGREVLYFSR